MDYFGDFISEMKSMNKSHEERENEFKRLKSETPKSIKRGDRVLVAVGLLGHGFHYVRQECVVLRVSGNNSKIYWKSDGYRWSYWIDNALIVEVLTSSR